MKMSDVFELPVNSGMKAATKASAIHDARGTFGILNDQAVRHVAHAINNHDRLQQEKAELREALQSMVDGYASYDLVHHTGLTQDECQKIIDLALNK